MWSVVEFKSATYGVPLAGVFFFGYSAESLDVMSQLAKAHCSADIVVAKRSRKASCRLSRNSFNYGGVQHPLSSSHVSYRRVWFVDSTEQILERQSGPGME